MKRNIPYCIDATKSVNQIYAFSMALENGKRMRGLTGQSQNGGNQYLWTYQKRAIACEKL